MSQADPKDTTLDNETQETLEETVGPTLGFEGSDNCIRAEELEEEEHGIYSNRLSTLEDYDKLTDEDIVMGPQRSAKILDRYFGQHSRSDEPLSDFLDPFDTGVPKLENNVVLDLSLYSYEDEGRQQHVKYHEGEVAREVVEYLDSESSWSSRTYFIEDSEKLFIQNNP
jgi:hypothetical protein